MSTKIKILLKTETKETTLVTEKIKLKPKPQTILEIPPIIKKKYQSTQYFSKLLTSQESNTIFQHLIDTIKWNKGVYSSKAGKHTRLAKALSLSDDAKVKWAVLESLKRMNLTDYVIYGVYLNFYRDGEDYTPQHKHEDTTQLVISLNEVDGDRDLTIGKTKYHLGNGDAIIFGGSIHGVPKQPNRKRRISIATFMKHDPTLNGKIMYG